MTITFKLALINGFKKQKSCSGPYWVIKKMNDLTYRIHKDKTNIKTTHCTCSRKGEREKITIQTAVEGRQRKL